MSLRIWQLCLFFLLLSCCSTSSYSFENTSCWLNPTCSIYVENDEEDDQSNFEMSTSYVSTTSNDKRLVQWTSPRAPTTVVYCFAYAGGSSRTFEPWRDLLVHRNLTNDILLVAVEYPGRGARSEESLTNNETDDEIEVQMIASSIQKHMSRMSRGTDVR